MSKKKMGELESLDSEAFAIIELAIDDVDILTRAFRAISEACEELEEPSIMLEPELPEFLVH